MGDQTQGMRISKEIRLAISHRPPCFFENRLKLRSRLVASAALCKHEFGPRKTAQALRAMADFLERGVV